MLGITLGQHLDEVAGIAIAVSGFGFGQQRETVWAEFDPRSNRTFELLDCGENAEVVVHPVCDMDLPESRNMSVLLAFEWTQADPQMFCLNDIAL